MPIIKLNADGGSPMTPTITPEQLLSTLTRYIDQYHWRWNRAGHIINKFYGTAYTERELKALYKKK